MKSILFVVSVFFLFCSCSKKKEYDENILLKFGDSVLTYEDVTEKIPKGIMPEDSAAMFKSLVDAWIRDEVLSEFAEQRLYDTETIDRLTREYRNALIVQEYLSRMRASRTPHIDEGKIKEYYDLHKHELKLEMPLIRGIFMKFNSSVVNKEAIKKLLSNTDLENIDKLEQDWMDKALEYNYFRDKWVDWETISGMIPHRFGNPAEFLGNNNYFETDYEDCSYFLQISDYIPAGQIQPYEFAKTWIAHVLTQGDLAEYEKVLVDALVSQSIKNNKLEVIGYDPLMQELIKNSVDKEE